MAPVRDAIRLVLDGHEPYPALVVDRWWNLVAADASIALFTGADSAIAVPLLLRPGDAELTLFSTIATFGTAVDITVAELAIEAFFPADAQTAAALRDRAAAPVGAV